MANIAAIRARIKTAVEAANLGFKSVFATMPAQPPAALPCLIIAPASGVFLSEVTLDGAEDLELVAIVLVQKVSDAAAQDNADAFLSESVNVGDAIDAGKTADWDFCQSMPARNYGGFTFGGGGEGAVQYLGYEIPVTVATS